MREKEKRELALSKVILLAVALVCGLVIVWFAWIRPGLESVDVNSFDECVLAGYPVQESYPEVCVTPGGERFTNPDQQVQN